MHHEFESLVGRGELVDRTDFAHVWRTGRPA